LLSVLRDRLDRKIPRHSKKQKERNTVTSNGVLSNVANGGSFRQSALRHQRSLRRPGRRALLKYSQFEMQEAPAPWGFFAFDSRIPAIVAIV